MWPLLLAALDGEKALDLRRMHVCMCVYMCVRIYMHVGVWVCICVYLYKPITQKLGRLEGQGEKCKHTT